MKKVTQSYGFFLITWFVSSAIGLAKPAQEESVSALIGLHSPVYGKLKNTVSEKGEPALPTSIVTLGVGGQFIKKGFMVGGRLYTVDTDTRKGTTGSSFTTSVGGAFVGYALEWGVFDFSVSQLLGLGHRQFCSTGTQSSYCVKISFLAAEPQLSLGLSLSERFKVSAGYTYQLGFIDRASQLGTEAFTDPRKLTIGGSTLLLMISFGNIQ